MQTLVAHIEAEVAPIEVAVFNIGANVRFGVTDTTERVYRKVWEMGALAGFLMGREVAKAMLARGHGTIIFTGATASVRGSAGFAAFSGAKHALRALAQSMARELGPKGIHVAHVVIDGAIDTAFIAENFPERYALKEKAGILSPAAIADNYWNLHCQDKSAWTHELDLRPWMESLLMQRLEFFFDFGSPTSYLASTQLPRLMAETGAELVWRPMLLGGVFKATGNTSPVSVPAKGRWMNGDIALWAKRYGVPFTFNPHFPINTLPLMRGAAGLQMRRPQDFGRYADVIHRAMWEQPKNLGDPAVLASVLAENGFDAEALPGAHRRRGCESQARRRHRRSGVGAACSARRPSSSATRCSSARTGSISCAKRSRPSADAALAQRLVRSVQISGNSTTSSILRR